MSSDPDYTDSELRLLDCYKALQLIKEGRRQPNRARPAAVAGSKQAVQKDINPGSASAPLTSSTGQKLPSRIRLKATRQQGPAASGETGPTSPSAPKSPAGKASAGGAFEAAAAEPEAEQHQQTQATISRQELAALLRRKKLEQSQVARVDPLLQRTAEEETPSAADTAAAPAPVVRPVVSAEVAALPAGKEPSKQQAPKALHRAKLPLPGAPKTPKAAVAGPSVQMAEASKPPAAAAAAAAPAHEDIDYGAVSSPEYEVDYDAVSSPEYGAVSGGHHAQVAPPPPPAIAAAAAADDGLQPLPTPERQDGSSGRHVTSPAAAAVLAKPPLPPNGSDARTPLKTAPAAADATPAAARRRSGSRSRSRSRSPAYRRSRCSSRQRSPEQRRRSSCRSKSRSRSGSVSRGHRRSGSRQQQRSRSRSRGRGSHRRRASPDYTLGSRRQAGSSPSSSRSPVPRQRRQHGSRQGSRQPPQQQQHPTLFVGDLPPVGFSSADLQAMFSGHGWSVLGARVMGSQCYGFVEFEQQAEANEALALVNDGDPRFAVNGGQIRASWARGSMPDWKRGKAVLSKHNSSQGLEGLEAYEHPMARMLRLQAAAAAAQAMAGVIASELEPEEGQVAGPHHVPAAAVPGVRPLGAATRALVDYGDL